MKSKDCCFLCKQSVIFSIISLETQRFLGNSLFLKSTILITGKFALPNLSLIDMQSYFKFFTLTQVSILGVAETRITAALE